MDRLNYPFIVLILKNSFPESIGEYSTIALLNGMLKILSKVLAFRLTLFLQEMIKDTQMGFIAGQNILASVAIAQEVLYQCRNTNR